MANTRPKCTSCLKRILTHAKSAACSLCNTSWQFKCLPNYSTDDLTYANCPSNNWTCPHCLKDYFPFFDIDDNISLEQAILNPINSIIDLESLNAMVFDPFDSMEDEGEGVLGDIDPDQNYLREIRGKALNKCKYYYSSNQMSDIVEANKNSSLSMLHLNIRSTPKNLDTFVATLHSSAMEIDLITLSETWLKSSNADLHGIEGYAHEYLTRETRSGGGTSIYIKENWIYKIRNDLSHSSDEFEMLWIKIDKDSTNTPTNLIVGSIYRCPGANPTEFINKLQITLSTISLEDKEVIHMGDYNLNLLNADTHPPTTDLIDLNFSQSLYPVINKPTRITNSSATLIDNIFTSISFMTESNSGILMWDISDHFPVFLIKNKEIVSRDPISTFTRSHNAENKEKFSTLVNNSDWSEILNNTDTQEAYTLFHQTISNIYNKSFPLKKKKMGYENKLPWLTDGLMINQTQAYIAH
jgi:exonuclease III